MYEKLCFQWNDFKESVGSAFGRFKEDNNFADVTLVCENGSQIETHKVILAASSPFFENLLKMNKHPHPLVYMRGVNSEDLEALINFLYYGEANISQENLDSFLAIAQELQLKGLVGQNAAEVEENPLDVDRKAEKIEELNKFEQSSASDNVNQNRRLDGKKNRVERLTGYNLEDIIKLDLDVKSKMEKSKSKSSLHICKVCGKEGQTTSIKNHIEANHMNGVSIPCNYCNKTCRSRNAMWMHNKMHNKREHKD